MPLTPEQRRQRAKIAALIRWSQEDPAPNAARGQAGLMAKFEKEVDPDGALDPAERARRVEARRKAHFAQLAFRSARARSRRTGEPQDAA